MAGGSSVLGVIMACVIYRDGEGHIKLWDLGSRRPRLSWRPIPQDTTLKGILSLHALDQGQTLVR